MELLLPVILFVLTLIIVFSLRAEDKRDRRIELLKQRMQRFSREIEFAQSQFKDVSQQTEERINQRVEDAHSLASEIDRRLADLQSRGDDLSKLQEVMDNYHTVLTRLGEITAQAEQRIEDVKGEIDRLEQVSREIAAFEQRMAVFREHLARGISEASETMVGFRDELEKREAAALATLRDYETEIMETERKGQQRIASHAQSLKANEEASRAAIQALAEQCLKLGAEQAAGLEAYRKQLALDREQASFEVSRQNREFERLCHAAAEQAALDEKRLEVLPDEARKRLDGVLEGFLQDCTSRMDSLYDRTVSRTESSFSSMMSVLRQYLDALASRVEETGAGSEKAKEVAGTVRAAGTPTTPGPADEAPVSTDRTAWVEYVPDGEEEVIVPDEEE
jgi:DNA repair exonuclease SbcCD ATPase subunit